MQGQEQEAKTGSSFKEQRPKLKIVYEKQTQVVISSDMNCNQVMVLSLGQ